MRSEGVATAGRRDTPITDDTSSPFLDAGLSASVSGRRLRAPDRAVTGMGATPGAEVGVGSSPVGRTAYTRKGVGSQDVHGSEVGVLATSSVGARGRKEGASSSSVPP